MANDNTLGAPTEGLGQTVTFTSAGVAVPQARGARRQGLQAGQRGSGAANLTARHGPIQDAREGSAVLDVFRRLGNDILAPRLEQARNDAFLTGMQRAAGGEAIKEIVNEQPWYSQVFGDTPVVEGARAFSSYAKVQEEALAIENDMPNLRQRSPTEVQAILSERIAATQTGDRGTDSLVMQSLMKEMPGLMKRHAKEHLGWQQANFAQQVRAGQATASHRLAATMARFDPAAKPAHILNGGDPGAFTDEGDILEAKTSYIAAFAQPAGLPFEAYDQLTTASIGDLLSQKNLHAYYVLQDSGIIDNLSPESATRLRNAADRAESRARAEMPTALIDELAKIKTLPALFDQDGIDEQLNERVANLNRKYNAITGAREPLLSGNTVAELKNSIMEKQIAADRKAREAWANAKDDAVSQLDAATLTASAMVEGRYVGDQTSAQRALSWEILRKDPERLHRARAKMVLAHEIDKVGANIIQQDAQVNFETDNVAGWHKLYEQEWLPLYAAGGAKATQAYFGDRHSDMTHYARSVTSGAKQPDELTAAFLRMKQPRQAETGNAAFRKELNDALGEAVKNTNESGWWLWGKHDLRPEQQSTLATLLAPAVQAEGSHQPMKERASAALTAAQRGGLEIGGGYYWQRSTEGPGILDALQDLPDPIPPEGLNSAVASTVAAYVDKLGIAEHSLSYQQENGVPYLVLLGMPEGGGVWRATPITLTDIHSTYKRSQMTQQERAQEEFLTAPDIRDSTSAKLIEAAGAKIVGGAKAVRDTKALPINPSLLRQREEDERKRQSRRNQ